MDYFEQFLKAFHQLAIQLDPNGVVVQANQTAADWLGLPISEFVGKPFDTLCHVKNQSSPFVKELFPLALHERLLLQQETFSVWPSGELRFLKWQALWLQNEIRGHSILLLGEDMSERVLMRQQEQKMNLRLKQLEENSALTHATSNAFQEARSLFLANISHDLKTPLHAVLGLAEILKFKQPMPEQTEYLDGILLAGQKILRIVDDAISCARTEAGKFQLQIEAFDLCKLMEEVMNALVPEANRKKLQMILSYPIDVPRWVESDVNAIRKILAHLLNNAVKFTQQGHVCMRATLVPVQAGSMEITITVEDTGVGIAPEHYEKIFDPFYRVQPSYTAAQSQAGSGVGLALSKQWIENLGGSLVLQSRIGKGSSFSFNLPLRAIEEQQSGEKDPIGFRVLIIDDLLVRAEALKQQLPESSAHQLSPSLEAWSVLQQAVATGKRFDVVLIDEGVQACNILELAQHIQKEPLFGQPLLLAMTGPKTLQAQQALKAAGFAHQWVKPLQPSDWGNTLQTLWKTHQTSMSVPAQSLPAIKNQRALLVEDNVFSQRVARVMLENLGCSVTIVATGESAMRALAEQDFEIVFLDLELPDMDGLELTQKIRQESKRNRGIYICALTAHVDRAARQRSLESGMDDFLGKPVQLDQFRRVVNQIKTGGAVKAVSGGRK